MADSGYVFPGVTPFFEAAAAEFGLTCRDTLHKAKRGWFVDRIVEVLSGMGLLVASARAGMQRADAPNDLVVHLRELQRGLKVQSAALDAAIADALAGYGLADPTVETPTTKETKRAANKRQ